MPEKILWQPHKGAQTRALQQTAKEILFGGSRGGGKTSAGIAWMIEPTYLNNPSYRGLVIRRNYDDLRDWIDRAKIFYTSLGVKVTGNPAEFRFPSGAKIRTGHLADSDATYKYLGHEYHKILIEELTIIPTEENYLRLISTCRSTIKELEPQVFCTTNPGGVGHQWVKQRWVDVARNKEYIDPVTSQSRIFIPSQVYDNPTLMEADPNYVKHLEGLPEELRRAWLDGDWDVFSGQYFNKFRYEKHVCKPFKIPKDWYRYRSIDYGFANYFATIWTAVDFDGNAYVYREHYEKQQPLSYHTAKILELSGDEKYQNTLADPAMWIRNPQNTNNWSNAMPSHMSIAEIMTTDGVPVNRANNDRVNGWNVVREYLEWNDSDKPEPRIKFFSNCKNLIRTLPMLVHSEKRPEDLDTTQEDHLADALRYNLMYLGRPSKETTKPFLQRELEKLLAMESNIDGVRN
tara:strand:+ start:3416 stop:4795 length:1380 start_codon:yes stop_codon:yes gene_type:complete